MRRGDGTGAVEELFPQDGAQFAGSISPSRVLAYAHDKDGASDIWVLPLDGDRKGHPFIETAAFEYGPEFSPDGKWIAYVSNESGTQGVYVVPYPGPGPKRRVSAQGGVSPVWSRDGRELFFQADDGLMSARVTAGADIQFDTPRRLFGPTFMVDSREDGPRGYDVSPDGQRFLMLRFVPAPAAVLSFHVLLDWAAALKPAAAR
jgi:dipeptidyl aminopeptidase/acylaminoacyl peptidase